MTGFKIILFCVLTACLLSVLHVWTIELTNVDWRICFDNWGNPEPLIRVSEMSFQEQVHAVFNESIFGKLFAFVFLMLPYLPIFWLGLLEWTKAVLVVDNNFSNIELTVFTILSNFR